MRQIFGNILFISGNSFDKRKGVFLCPTFFAMLSRMKYINRWGLMRNTRNETICEHSLDTAILAHALAVLLKPPVWRQCQPGEKAALLAKSSTTHRKFITGDLPTPIKYYNPTIRTAYQEVERMAEDRLLAYLPDDLRPDYKGTAAPKKLPKMRNCCLL